MNDRIIISIGGGELKGKTTNKIDEYVATLAKKRAGSQRAYGLFLGTASHDSMPYFNTFRKTYTSDFDVKADCALTVYGEMSYDKIRDKFYKADMIYIGGGDTVFMIDYWKKCGVLDLVIDAYRRGVVMCGLSAGAIFWFNKMYTDSACNTDSPNLYSIHDGLGILDGVCTPHYNERLIDFDKIFLDKCLNSALAIENDCAVQFVNEKLIGCISSGGKAYILRNNFGVIEKFELSNI